MSQSTSYEASFFSNESCPYFPCHEGVPREKFNCLFCYCPLYALGADCGGDFSYTDNGIKDCSECNVMHCATEGEKRLAQHLDQLAKLASNEQ